MSVAGEALKLFGKVIGKGEKGAKVAVEWSNDIGKAVKGSKCVISKTADAKVLSRPMAETNKASHFAKKYGNITYKTTDGTSASRFTYAGGKIHDLKTGNSFRPREFPAHLEKAKLEMEMAKTAGKTAKAGEAVAKEGKTNYVKGFMERHKKIEGIVGATGLGFGALGLAKGYKAITGETITHTAVGALVPDEGLGNDVGRIVMGEKDYEAFHNGIYNFFAEVQNLYGTGKDDVSAVMNEFTRAYKYGKEKALEGGDNAKDFVQRLIHGDGGGNAYITDENGYSSDPSMQGSSMFNSSNISRLTNPISNGNVSAMDLGTLLLSGYLMFGRAGWMSKAVSMLLGAHAMKDINRRSYGINQSQGQQQNQQVQGNYQYQKALQSLPDTERETVHVTRGI